MGGGWWVREGEIRSTVNYRTTASLTASAWEREEGEVSGKHRRKRNTCQHAQGGRGNRTGQARRGRGRGRTRLRHPPWLVCCSLGNSAFSWSRFLKGWRSTTWPISVLYTIMPTLMAWRSTASESMRMPTKSFSCSHSLALMEAEASNRNTTSAGMSHRTTGTHSRMRWCGML